MNLEEKILARAKENGGILSYNDYIDICLYDDDFGYYKKNKIRTGAGGDFFTSSSLKNKLFGKLLYAAAEQILSASNRDIAQYKVVEIGAEPDCAMIENSEIIRLGEEIDISGNVVVISNELIDARPFERFEFRNNAWRKRMIDFSNGFKKRAEILITPEKCEVSLLEKYFPHAKVEGFKLDISFDALKLFENICAQNWRGVLIFADYFRFASELEILPNGTARTYFKHTQDDDLFANIGETDITYSPCSEMFEDVAQKFGMSASTLSQEQFIVKYASRLAEKIISNPDPTDPLKRELCQLISPVHMGACFRILFATKGV